MAQVTDDSILISIPFAVPMLGITEPTTIAINKHYLQLFVRIVVGICSIFLFWPKVASAFGLGSRRDTEAEQRDIQERIAKLEHERDTRAQEQKSYAVATGTGTTATPTKATTAQKTGGAKRRKA